MHKMYRTLQCFILVLCTALSHANADTMDHYMNIAGNIPVMELKADPQAQAWARSARNILILTSESIVESLNLANESATRQGSPLFCLKNNTTLTAAQMNDLIQQTFKDLSSKDSDKNNMTVSQLALLGLRKNYPCELAPEV